MAKFGDAEKIVQRCERTRTQLWNEFERIRPKLTEIARYIYPCALSGLVRDIRELNAEATYDADDAERFTTVPFDAFRVAYSGFYVNLTNPSAQWFRLGSPDYNRNEDEKDYYAESYQKVTNATRWLMGWCGAYRALHLCYKHLVAFGFAAMLAEEDAERIVRVTCLRMGTYALGIDRTGKVDRLVRHFAFTAEQMVQEFGEENLAEPVVEAAKRGDLSARYEVWNVVEPHVRIAGAKSPFTLSRARFAYRSVYWSQEAGARKNFGLLAVRGYRIRPLVAPRLTFEVGDTYGRGCGHDALGHCRALQTMAESQIDLADQEAHPSMMAPASMADDGLRLGPLDVNWYPDSLRPNAVYRTIGDPPRGERTSAELARLEAEIRKSFFNAEFETISALQDNEAMSPAGKMTATEVKARVNEKMEQLAGIATTLNDELLDPFVVTMAAYAMMAGLVNAELPPGAGGILPWDVRYESALHAAANAQPINAAMNSLNSAATLSQMNQDPSVLDNFDADALVRDIHRKLGAPENYLRTSDERDKIRAERAQAAQQAQQMQEAALRAKAIKDVASAPVTPDTIGGALAGAGQQEGLVA